MSKKFIVFSLALFALIINIALAVYFTLPLDSQEVANHRMKASITDSSLETSNLEASAQSESVAKDSNEARLAQTPTQDMSLGTEEAPVAEIPAENIENENVELAEQNSETLPVLNDSYMQKLTQTSQNTLKSPMQIVKELEEAEAAKKALENEEEMPAQEIAEAEEIAQASESEVATTPSIEPAVKIQTMPEAVIEEVEEVEEAPKAVRKVVNEITIGYAGNVLTLRLKGNQAMKGKTMYVGNPERALLDIEGKWYLPEMPQFPPNPYSTSIRTGYQETTTRFVIDITTTKFTRRLVQIDSNTVELRVTFQ